MGAGVLVKGLSKKISEEMEWDVKMVDKVLPMLLMTGYCQALADMYRDGLVSEDEVIRIIVKSQWGEFVEYLPMMWGKFTEMDAAEIADTKVRWKKAYEEYVLEKARELLGDKKGENDERN